jgi:scyllo-inositol 2-dehydrogenase (NADP+)
MAEVKIGVLGVGRMGLIHCQQITDIPGLELVAVSSKATELIKIAGDRFPVKTYLSHEKLLKDENVEWVVITTTTEKHHQWALKALSAGKELIIEKPIALSLREAEQIFESAAKKGLRVTVHNNRRWDQDFKLVRKVLQESTLGEVYRIESRYTHCSDTWGTWGSEGARNPWRLKKSYGGGLLNDWGPHLFDQLILLTDSRVTTLFGKTYAKIWSKEVEDHFWAEVLFENRLSARVEASNNFRIAQSRWCLVGTEGTLAVEGGDPSDWKTAVIRRRNDEFPEEIRIDISQPELSAGFYQAFVQALQASAALPVSPEHVLRVMRLIEAVRESDRTGQSISLVEC